MPYFPVCLDLRDRPCLVIGGGRVATRKAASLLACEARVTVISPELSPDLAERAAAGTIHWLSRAYREGDLAGAFLVIAATDDSKTQSLVQAEADQRQVLLNVADVPDKCNFILPATVRRGDLTIAVSTGGKSPALASALREDLEGLFGREYQILVDILGRLRPLVLARGKSSRENKEQFKKLAHHDMLRWIQERNIPAMQDHIRLILGEAIALDWLEDALG